MNRKAFVGSLLLAVFVIDYVRTRIENFQISRDWERAQKLVEKQQRIVDGYTSALDSCRLTLDTEMEQSRHRIVTGLLMSTVYKKAARGDRRSAEYLSSRGIIIRP